MTSQSRLISFNLTASQCIRLNKKCEYHPDDPNVTASASSPAAKQAPAVSVAQTDLSGRLKSLEQLLQVSVDADHGAFGNAMSSDSCRTAMNKEFPTCFFLDPDHFSPVGHHSLSREVPCFVQKAIRLTKDDWPKICDDFFSTIHTWLPMLSKKRLLHQIESGNAEHQGENAPLLVCMKLSTHILGTPDGSSLYNTAKSCLFFAESGGFLSLRLLQALILLCLFELGHGVYPAAYLTAGRVARLACVMGLQDRKQAQQLYVSADTWTQREEMQRTWWAVLLVERLAVLGNPALPLTAPQPGANDLLPCNEETWNNGVIGTNEPLLVTSFHSAPSLGSFARTCQAVHVLGKVIKNVTRWRDPESDVTETITEAMKLHKALVALTASLDVPGASSDLTAAAYPSPDSGRPGDEQHCALALCASALCLWNNEYGCNERRPGHLGRRIALETEAQNIGYQTVKALCLNTAPRLARHAAQLAASPADKPRICHIASHSLYIAAVDCKGLLKEYGGSDELRNALKQIVDGVEAIQSQWLVGDEYMKLLDKDGVLQWLMRDERPTMLL